MGETIKDWPREVRLAYSRGYNRGSSGKWPHPSAMPKPGLVRDLAIAARELSDAADDLMAGFCDRDEDPRQVAIDAARDKVLYCLAEMAHAALEEHERPHAD